MSDTGRKLYATNLNPRRPQAGNTLTFNVMGKDNEVVILGLAMEVDRTLPRSEKGVTIIGQLSTDSAAKVIDVHQTPLLNSGSKVFVVMLIDSLLGEGEVELEDEASTRLTFG